MIHDLTLVLALLFEVSGVSCREVETCGLLFIRRVRRLRTKAPCLMEIGDFGCGSGETPMQAPPADCKSALPGDAELVL